MAVPKKKTTKSKRGKRRGQDRVNLALTECLRCHKLVQPHTVCLYCGYYGGKEVIKIEPKIKKEKNKE